MMREVLPAIPWLVGGYLIGSGRHKLLPLWGAFCGAATITFHALAGD